MVRLEKTPINNIKPNDYNPNVMNKHKFDTMVENIKTDGEMLQPILVNKKFIIIDGEHRWKASKKAGLKEIWTVIAETTNEEAKLKTVSFNQIRGDYDEEKFIDLLKDLSDEIDYDKIAKETSMFISDIKTMLGEYENQIGKTEYLDGLIKGGTDNEDDIIGFPEAFDESQGLFENEENKVPNIEFKDTEKIENEDEIFSNLNEERDIPVKYGVDNTIELNIECSVEDMAIINQAFIILREMPGNNGLNQGQLLVKFFKEHIKNL